MNRWNGTHDELMGRIWELVSHQPTHCIEPGEVWAVEILTAVFGLEWYAEFRKLSNAGIDWEKVRQIRGRKKQQEAIEKMAEEKEMPKRQFWRASSILYDSLG